MTLCDRVRELIAEQGRSALTSHALLNAHALECLDCNRLLVALDDIEHALETLPEHDAPDDLIVNILSAVGSDGEIRHASSERPTGDRRWAAMLGSAAVLVAAIGLTQSIIPLQEDIWTRSGADGFSQSTVVGQSSAPVGEDMLLKPDAKSNRSEAGGREASVFADTEIVYEVSLEEAVEQQRQAGKKRSRELPEAEAVLLAPAVPEPVLAEIADEEPALDNESRKEQLPRSLVMGNVVERDNAVEAQDKLQAEPGVFIAPKNAPAGSQAARGAQFLAENKRLVAPTDRSVVAEEFRRDANLSASDLDSFEKTIDARLQPPAPVTESTSASLKQKAGILLATEGMDDAVEAMAEPELASNILVQTPARRSDAILAKDKQVASKPVSATHARDFLTAINSHEGVEFQSATGYWANTYVPGDPAIRSLQARLARWDPNAMAGMPRLDKVTQAVRQPFDVPRNAALAAYLHADKRSFSGPERMRVQVGLQGSYRQGGQRPAMNIGVVLDLRGATRNGFEAEIRALLTALQKTRRSDDRFTLVVAGPGGGVAVSAEHFRHGALQIALNGLFNGPSGNSTAVSLPVALALATEAVQHDDDPASALGASLVLLVTAAPLTAELPELEQAAHANAVAGIPLSAVSLGGQAQARAIERLVLAGQGNRRVLADPEHAATLIDHELHAASRVIARAVRLRIRLAPGVRLIEVLGSQRLGEPQAARVREAEHSVDARLSRSLGIAADRGDDEEGIQIVIPMMEAGASHVVLLDVVAERPGPIADLTVRYKDLVYLRNGIARARLELGAGNDSASQQPGALELSVLKNLVSLKLSEASRQAGEFLAAGDPQSATATLQAMQRLLQGLRFEVAGWNQDVDLQNDEQTLNNYLTLLSSASINVVEQRQQIIDSLQLSAYRKLIREIE